MNENDKHEDEETNSSNEPFNELLNCISEDRNDTQDSKEDRDNDNFYSGNITDIKQNDVNVVSLGDDVEQGGYRWNRNANNANKKPRNYKFDNTDESHGLFDNVDESLGLWYGWHEAPYPNLFSRETKPEPTTGCKDLTFIVKQDIVPKVSLLLVICFVSFSTERKNCW